MNGLNNLIVLMKKVSRNWTQQEDQILTDIMTKQSKKKQDKLKWDQIANVLQQRQQCQKTGKQCRQRWHNQLAPQSSNRGQWTPEENELLFNLHDMVGNKWAKIAQEIEGRTDNTIKNHFYSTMRRGLRKLNSYIHNVKRKNGPVKEFKAEILNKILIVVDGNQNDKLDAKNNAFSLSKDIKRNLSIISLDVEDSDDTRHALKQTLFNQISEFAKNCKRRKGKKVGVISASQAEKQSSVEEEVEEKQIKKAKNKQKSNEETKSKQEKQFKLEIDRLPFSESETGKQKKPSKTTIKNKNSIESVGSVGSNPTYNFFETHPLTSLLDMAFKDKGTVEFGHSIERSDNIPFNLNTVLESPKPQLRSFYYSVTPGTPISNLNFNNINTNNMFVNPQPEQFEGSFYDKNSYDKRNQ